MGKWLYAVYTLCQSPELEKEFNVWYDKIHIPDILKIPGFIHATRYKIRGPVEGQGNYLSLYEIETEDIDKTMAVEHDVVTKLGEQGRMSDVAVVVSRALYQKISDISPK
jgi:hypothetical protein